jgi:hypothetical protein
MSVEPGHAANIVIVEPESLVSIEETLKLPQHFVMRNARFTFSRLDQLAAATIYSKTTAGCV